MTHHDIIRLHGVTGSHTREVLNWHVLTMLFTKCHMTTFSSLHQSNALEDSPNEPFGTELVCARSPNLICFLEYTIMRPVPRRDFSICCHFPRLETRVMTRHTFSYDGGSTSAAWASRERKCVDVSTQSWHQLSTNQARHNVN